MACFTEYLRNKAKYTQNAYHLFFKDIALGRYISIEDFG